MLEAPKTERGRTCLFESTRWPKKPKAGAGRKKEKEGLRWDAEINAGQRASSSDTMIRRVLLRAEAGGRVSCIDFSTVVQFFGRCRNRSRVVVILGWISKEGWDGFECAPQRERDTPLRPSNRDLALLCFALPCCAPLQFQCFALLLVGEMLAASERVASVSREGQAPTAR